MHFKSVALPLAALVCSLSLASTALADFRPFTTVKNVCPSCEPERFDRMQLEGGDELDAWIVRDNGSSLLLERHGELRLISRSKVGEIKLSPQRDDAERKRIAAKHADQIVLENGHVLSGRITDTGKAYQLVSTKGVTYTAQAPQIREVIRQGKSSKP
ncbi:MAG: hypothetical protein R6X02_27555 [Enhygromyxa sp.]